MKLSSRAIRNLFTLLILCTTRICLADGLLTLDGRTDAINVSQHFSYVRDLEQSLEVADLLASPDRFILNENSKLDFGLVKGDLWLRLEFKVEESIKRSGLWYLDLGMAPPTLLMYTITLTTAK
jgi:hypothetical protein